ncbi:unnamed protein product, partial [Strongylus vulgaris]
MRTINASLQIQLKFGSRSIVTFFGFFSALCTALIPLCAHLGFYWMVVMRFLQVELHLIRKISFLTYLNGRISLPGPIRYEFALIGTGLSTGFTLIGIITRQWSMQKQSAFFIAFLTCFFQIGPIFTMPVAGALCTSSLGWSWVYYLHAFITVILFALFQYFYREQPDYHSFVSAKELDRIKRGKGDTAKKEPVPVKVGAKKYVFPFFSAFDQSQPVEQLSEGGANNFSQSQLFQAIITSNAIIAVWISALGNFMGIQVTMQFSPTYLNK